MISFDSFFIRELLRRAHPQAHIHLLDGEYVLLERSAWAQLHREFAAHMARRGFAQWVADKGDCDDWAWMLRAWIIERNWSQALSRLPVAIAYLHYTTRQGEYHAINAPIVPTEVGGLTLAYLEPQPERGGLVDLSDDESASCDLIII